MDEVEVVDARLRVTENLDHADFLCLSPLLVLLTHEAVEGVLQRVVLRVPLVVLGGGDEQAPLEGVRAQLALGEFEGRMLLLLLLLLMLC